MAKLKTGRHTSALKEARKNDRNWAHNIGIKSHIHTLAKKLERAIAEGNVALTRTLSQETFSAWDKAAKTNIIHWKAAARKKSRLALQLQKLVKPSQAKQ